jgi:hypothetical protein
MSRFEDLNPPAIVQPAESLGQLIDRARDMHRDLAAVEHLSLQKAVELGKTLEKAKALCKRGEWLPTLQRMGIDRRRASEVRALAKCPAPDISSCTSIREALRLVGHNGMEEEEPEAAGSATETKPILCLRCQRTGQARDCPQCAELARRSNKSGAQGRHGETDGEEKKDGQNGTGRRRARDDTDRSAEHATKQNGRRQSLRKKAETALGIVVRFLDKHGLYAKHKAALDSVLKEIKLS